MGQSRRSLYRRLEHGQRSLERGSGNVGDVAYAVGFRGVSHFSRRFREHFGKSPSAVRRGRSDS